MQGHRHFQNYARAFRVGMGARLSDRYFTKACGAMSQTIRSDDSCSGCQRHDQLVQLDRIQSVAANSLFPSQVFSWC